MKRCFVTTFIAAIAMAFASVSMADLLDDGDFEATGAAAGWSYASAPNNADQDAAAPGIDAPIEANETLFLSGNFLGGATVSFSQAFQDVAVDGVHYSVGDDVFVKGLLAHQTSNPLTSLNNAWLEIGFINSGLGEFATQDSAGITASSALDQYIEISTATIAIPANTDILRVKVRYRQQGNATGAAWAEKIQLVNVTSPIPEPGTVSLIALGLLGIAMRRRRS